VIADSRPPHLQPVHASGSAGSCTGARAADVAGPSRLALTAVSTPRHAQRDLLRRRVHAVTPACSTHAQFGRAVPSRSAELPVTALRVPDGAVAVTGNVTSSPDGAGVLTVAPSLATGQPAHRRSTPEDDIRANASRSARCGGKLDAITGGLNVDTVNVLFDVTGYFATTRPRHVPRDHAVGRRLAHLQRRRHVPFRPSSLPVTPLRLPSDASPSPQLTIVGQTVWLRSLAPSLAATHGTSTINSRR